MVNHHSQCSTFILASSFMAQSIAARFDFKPYDLEHDEL